MPTPGDHMQLIGVVGPCAAGKTTLIENLAKHGFRCRHIAQEHSYVADMWQRLTKPDVLIFLDASYETTVIRRKLTWTIDEYNKQQHRLRHARAHANFLLYTDAMTEQEVLAEVLHFLEHKPG